MAQAKQHKMSQEFINFDSAGTETKCMCLEPDETFYTTYSDPDHEDGDVILCERCVCENLEITTRDDNEESIGGDTKELTNQSNYTVINTPADAVNHIKVGDHVAWEREKDIVLLTVKYNHHAIVESIDDKYMSVIEYKKLPNAKKLTVERTTYSLSCVDEISYGYFFCIHYSRQLISHNPSWLVLQRAKSKLGKGGYNLFLNNCESFATFCKRGVSRTLQVSEKICKSLDVLKKELSVICNSPRFVVLVGQIARAEGIEEIVKVSTGMANANLVGGVLYLVSEGMFCCMDMYKLAGMRRDKSITTEQFIKLAVKRVVLAISKVIVGTTTGIIGAGAGSFAGGVIGCVVTLGTFPGLMIGAGVGSLIGSVLGGVGGVATFNGSRTILWSLSHSKDVESIKWLRLGDHVIIPGEAFLHPRCHAIISGIDRTDNKVKVIRNDYKRGVVEEWIAYVPMKRMVYNVGECYPVLKVLENAKSKLGIKRYSIATYNCKTFAVEQKMKKELNF
ncbi:uncharacterized protein [Apostichopus japonicus]|uniref:uncharacterized protein isoform X2 n=1 Tax=Stichopus japonicus TaxID=307972 RepID=UPI003AB70E99